MITYAREEWILQLKKIWKECFHDEDEYINFYFENRFVPEEVLVWLENQNPVAMVSLLPALLWRKEDGTQKQKLSYLYAVATLPAYGGRGISSSLIRFIQKKLKEENSVGLLVPAEPSLVDFYQKRGFYTVLEEKSRVYTRRGEAEIPFEGTASDKKSPLSILPGIPSAERYKQIRDRHFGRSGYVEWDQKAISYAQKEKLRSGGICRELCLDGNSHIMMGVKREKEFVIQESTLSENQLEDHKETLLSCFACEQLGIKEMLCMSNLPGWESGGYFNLPLN